MTSTESEFRKNVSSNSGTKYSDLILETPDYTKKLNQSTANLLELVRVLENIEVTPERMKQNAWGGVTDDGKRFVY